MLRTMISLGCLLSVVSQFATASSARAAETTKQVEKAERSWLPNAGFGLMVHYQVFDVDRLSPEEYDARVEELDVEQFADLVQRSGATYVIWTLGQNSGYYCAPNQTYDTLLGGEAGRKTARRDVPLELGQALRKRGVRLMLYLPSRAPQRDAAAMKALGDVGERKPTTQKFIENWSAICREWSLRYGDLVSGWWFDGYYVPAGWNDLSREFNARTWSEAVRAGNPNAELAFNLGSGRGKAFARSNDFQTYTAGEMPGLSETPATIPAPEGMHWQVMTYLGHTWGKGDQPRFDAPTLLRYIDTINAQGGALTLDVQLTNQGDIGQPMLDLLLALGQERAALTNGRLDQHLQSTP